MLVNEWDKLLQTGRDTSYILVRCRAAEPRGIQALDRPERSDLVSNTMPASLQIPVQVRAQNVVVVPPPLPKILKYKVINLSSDKEEELGSGPPTNKQSCQKSFSKRQTPSDRQRYSSLRSKIHQPETCHLHKPLFSFLNRRQIKPSGENSVGSLIFEDYLLR